MELKPEMQLSGNPQTFSSMLLGYLSFLLLWLAFGKGYCLLNPPSVFLLEESFIISDGENKGKESQHLIGTSAVFKALRMGFLRVAQEADQHFSISPVSKLGTSQLCHLRFRSQGTVPRNQLAQNTCMLLCRQALSLLLRKACCSLWTCLENPAAGCSGRTSYCWAATCSSSGSLSSSWAIWHCQTLMLQKWRQDVTSPAQLYVHSLRSE